jgi:hypothetical protein
MIFLNGKLELCDVVICTTHYIFMYLTHKPFQVDITCRVSTTCIHRSQWDWSTWCTGRSIRWQSSSQSLHFQPVLRSTSFVNGDGRIAIFVKSPITWASVVRSIGWQKGTGGTPMKSLPTSWTLFQGNVFDRASDSASISHASTLSKAKFCFR